MRYAEGHKSQTRERILQAAGRQIRRQGFQGISLNGVMAEAGLTHGSFYAHFRSRDDLLANAVEQMFVESPVSILLGAGRRPADALSDFVEYYLSAEHRDAESAGCPLPFLAADAPQLGEALRQRFSKGVAGMAAIIAGHLRELEIRDADDIALSVVSEIVGTMILSRLETGKVRSDVMLGQSRAQIRQRLGLPR